MSEKEQLVAAERRKVIVAELDANPGVRLLSEQFGARLKEIKLL